MWTQDEAIQKLCRQRDLTEDLKDYSPYSEAFRQWHHDTDTLIAQVCSEYKQAQQAFKDILYTPLFLSCRGGDTVFEEAYQEGLQAARQLLGSLAEALIGQENVLHR
jgi:hypothetical protein